MCGSRMRSSNRNAQHRITLGHRPAHLAAHHESCCGRGRDSTRDPASKIVGVIVVLIRTALVWDRLWTTCGHRLCEG
jgi:hypothetical protein